MLGMKNRSKRKHLAKTLLMNLPWQPQGGTAAAFCCSWARGVAEAGLHCSRLCDLHLMSECLGLITEQLVWVALTDSIFRGAPGPCVMCSDCGAAAENVRELFPHCDLHWQETTHLRLQHFCFVGYPETKHMVVANPFTSSELSSNRFISEGALRALWLTACLSFTMFFSFSGLGRKAWN